MGLPSGLLWASCNIGAVRPSDLGLYFSWGNTEGHEEGSGYNFNQAEYNTTPGSAIAANLSLTEDAARANLGEPWRMPTSNEFLELYNNCTTVWSTLNGVKGLIFTSNVNGNSIFFPAAGYYSGTSLVSLDGWGYYWSSTYWSETDARLLRFNSAAVSPQNNYYRRLGFPIRPVVPSL